jgi:serine/threonine protein kinase/Tol biopolymer transport system component
MSAPMALPPGTRFGPFEILSLLGVGGMGEVYRARDTRLQRDVAVKVLPDEWARDSSRLARFTREAQVLASLNHPHIAAIHGLEQSNDVQALILELVDGVTLAERIAVSPIPLHEAVTIARQIAEALGAAHAAGIIHRDLKPANIKLRPDGTVKVLDFGLAKSFGQTLSAHSLTQSPTALSPSPTLEGVILGTAAYMSPEQARGKVVDKRTDVWSFGCVLFEMLSGRTPFEGETLTDVVAAIVKNEPDWRALPAGIPAGVRAVIARSLKKDPAERLHDIADGRFQLEDALNDTVVSGVAPSPRGNLAAWAGWIVATLSLSGVLWLASRPALDPPLGDPVSIPILPPGDAAFSEAINTTVNVPSFAVSPDGHAVVFSAETPGGRQTLWVRAMDRVAPRQLAGTEDAQDPIWSPDGRWIAFFANGELKKIPAAGGAVQVITRTTADFRGGSWGLDDTILIALGAEPIQRVDAAGGKPTPVTFIDTANQEASHRNPHMLPDGQHFLYSVFGGQPDQNGVYLGSLDGKTKKILVNLRTNAVYAPPGYLLFVDGNALLGQRFDPRRLEPEGQPFVVAEDVGRNTAFMGAVSASRTGMIAYADTMLQNGRLTWIDRTGTPTASIGADGDHIDFRLSPDDQRLAVSLVDPKTNVVEIWITDLARSSTTRVSSGGLVTNSALWAPDGTRLMFRSNRNGIIEFFEKSTGGGGNDRLVLAGAQMPSLNLIPTDWSPDGRHVVFSAPAPGSANDLWLWPVAGEDKLVKLIASPGNQMHGNFSPAGGLLAYTSDETGAFEVYVETVPRSDRKWTISTNGGYEPRWRADGRELYYLSKDRSLMAVKVSAGPSFGIPTALFQTGLRAGVMALRTHYVPSRDGQRFLVNTPVPTPTAPITVVLNWAATLKQ